MCIGARVWWINLNEIGRWIGLSFGKSECMAYFAFAFADTQWGWGANTSYLIAGMADCLTAESSDRWYALSDKWMDPWMKSHTPSTKHPRMHAEFLIVFVFVVIRITSHRARHTTPTTFKQLVHLFHQIAISVHMVRYGRVYHAVVRTSYFRFTTSFMEWIFLKPTSPIPRTICLLIDVNFMESFFFVSNDNAFYGLYSFVAVQQCTLIHMHAHRPLSSACCACFYLSLWLFTLYSNNRDGWYIYKW